MLLRLEKDEFKVISTNAKDLTDNYVFLYRGKEYFLLSLEMAISWEFHITAHIYNPSERKFCCIDLPIEFLQLKDFGENFLIGRRLIHLEPLSKGLNRRKTFELIFADKKKFGISPNVEFQVCL